MTTTDAEPKTRTGVARPNKKFWRMIGAVVAVLIIAGAGIWAILNKKQEYVQDKQLFVATVEGADWEILFLEAPGKAWWYKMPDLGIGDDEWRAQVKAGRCELTITAPQARPNAATVHIPSTTPTLASPVSDLTSKKVEAINFYLNLGHCYADGPMAIGTP